jgi:hypothetical protein
VLVPFFLALLVAYHGLNAIRAGEYRRSFKWLPSDIRLTWGARSWGVPTVSAVKNLSGAIDAGSRTLAQGGAIARFTTGQIRKYALAGVPLPYQWIFAREEARFQYRPDPDWVEGSYLHALRPWIAALERHRITVTLVPVPTKMAIEPSALVSERPSWDWFVVPDGVVDPTAGYGRLIALLGGRAVDLVSAWNAYRRKDPSAIFFHPMGTHWSSLGATLAVAALVDNGRARGEPWNAISPRRVGESPPDPDIDFLDLLLLPHWFVASHPALAWPEPRYELNRSATAQAPAGRLVLIGSSYSGNPRSGSFRDLLAGAFHASLLQFVDSGDNRGLGALARLRDDGPALRPGDRVIFEFAYRFPWTADETLPLPRFE